MKIVSKSTDLLEFEHRSWSAALSAFGLFLFFSIGLVFGGEKQVHVHAFGTLFVTTIAVGVLAVMETSRIAFDRRSGTVRMFRKTVFGERRLELPFDEFKGVLPEKVFYHKGWRRRLALVFSNDDETWLIPATRGTSPRLLVRLSDEINAWLGSTTNQAIRAAGLLIRDARPMDIIVLDRMIRRWIGRN